MTDIQINVLVSVSTVIVTLIVREWFAKRRENREKNNWQITNLKDYYFEEYLSENIKKPRKKL